MPSRNGRPSIFGGSALYCSDTRLSKRGCSRIHARRCTHALVRCITAFANFSGGGAGGPPLAARRAVQRPRQRPLRSVSSFKKIGITT